MVDPLLVDAAAATRRLLCLLAAVMAGACTSVTPPAVTVTGTATYRERLALPPDAVFEATLEDVSRAEVVKRSFFPITFPLTTGPGTSVQGPVDAPACCRVNPMRFQLSVTALFEYAIANCGGNT